MNSFIQPYIEGSQAEVRCPLYDPREVRWNRERFRRDAISILARANSLYVPSGKYPAIGWILLSRYDLDRIDRYSTTLRLEVGDATRSDNVGFLKNLCIVQAQCVTRGISSDPNALYLVRLTDRRGMCANEWFQSSINTRYNIRAPAYPQGGDGSGTYYTDSMNDGTTWTWETMLQNMWEQMGSFLGAWPGLPTTPSGTPEGFWFPGVGAWDALNDTLEHIGLTIAVDLTAESPYTIVESDADDAAFAALQTRYDGRLEDDLEWIDAGAARVPGIVKVLFRRRNSIYGTEETVRRDTPQWSTESVYEVSVSAPAEFSAATGRHYLWSDFTVRYDMDGSPLAADIATAATIAAERVEQYYSRISANGHVKKTYAGALPFKTGSQVDGVCWYQDYGCDPRHGWRTQIVSGYDPPWPGIWN